MSAIQPEKRLGKVMLWLAWLLLFAFLLWFFNGWYNKQVNPNQMPISYEHNGVFTVVLERNRFGHYLLDGHINNEPVTFFVDTGATTVSIPGKLAESLHLTPGVRSEANTAAGTVDVYQTRIDTLQLGKITLHDVRATINPSMELDEVLLGMSALQQLDFAQSGDTLTLYYLIP